LKSHVHIRATRGSAASGNLYDLVPETNFANDLDLSPLNLEAAYPSQGAIWANAVTGTNQVVIRSLNFSQRYEVPAGTTWHVETHDAPWLAVEPMVGKLTATNPSAFVRATFDPSGLAPGKYQTVMNFVPDNFPDLKVEIPVVFTVHKTALATLTIPDTAQFDIDPTHMEAPYSIRIAAPVTAKEPIEWVLQERILAFGNAFDCQRCSGTLQPGQEAQAIIIPKFRTVAVDDAVANTFYLFSSSAKDSVQIQVVGRIKAPH